MNLGMRAVVFGAALLWIGSAGAQSPASGKLEEGLNAYDEAIASKEPFHPGYKRALAAWEPLAQAGDLVAQYHVGLLYYFGAGGITIDQVKGIQLIKGAAQAGYPTAQAFMGLMSENGDGMFTKRGEPEALGWYLRAADGGQCAGVKRMVKAYENGELGLVKNPEIAKELTERLERCTRR